MGQDSKPISVLDARPAAVLIQVVPRRPSGICDSRSKKSVKAGWHRSITATRMKCGPRNLPDLLTAMMMDFTDSYGAPLFLPIMS